MEYSGTGYIGVGDYLDDDYLGFVFGYQSNRYVLLMHWRVA